MVILLSLCAAVVLAELLVRHTPLRALSAALLVILIGAVMANLGLIPAGSTPEAPVPIYDAIFAWLAPLAIFWLLLQVDLRRILEAGLPMLALFGIGAAGTTLGALLGFVLIGGGPRLGEHAAAVAGMYVGTYVGGSVNFNAVALHYEVTKAGVVFAGTVVVDNVMTTLWMLFNLAAPRVLGRWSRAPEDRALQGAEAESTKGGDEDEPVRDREPLDPARLGFAGAVGIGAVVGSKALASGCEGLGVPIPSMLILTVLALIVAQLRPRLAERWGDPFVGATALGMFAVYLFLAVVGAFCDVGALARTGPLAIDLSILAGTTVVVHGLLVFGAALLFGLPLRAAAVASQANIGGGTTALALARALGRDDLAAPGILVGALGTALGTFLGFLVAGLL